MKQITYTIILAAALFASCNSSAPKTEAPATVATTDTTAIADSVLATYQCPMKCQGDTTFNAPGQCAVCGMDLEKL